MVYIIYIYSIYNNIRYIIYKFCVCILLIKVQPCRNTGTAKEMEKEEDFRDHGLHMDRDTCIHNIHIGK